MVVYTGKKIRVYNEVWMDLPKLLENVLANIQEARQCSEGQIGHYLRYAEDYGRAAKLLISDEPICLLHAKVKVPCSCGCKIICHECIEEKNGQQKKKRGRKRKN